MLRGLSCRSPDRRAAAGAGEKIVAVDGVFPPVAPRPIDREPNKGRTGERLGRIPALRLSCGPCRLGGVFESGRFDRRRPDRRHLLLRTLVLRRILPRRSAPAGRKVRRHSASPFGGRRGGQRRACRSCRRVAVNLNYTCFVGYLNYCLDPVQYPPCADQPDGFMEKVPLEARRRVRLSRRLQGSRHAVGQAGRLGRSLICRPGMLERRLGIDRLKPDDLLTVIFTSGSTGQPKGVMLSYRNIGSECRGDRRDGSTVRRATCCWASCRCSIRFGFTVTLWVSAGARHKGGLPLQPARGAQSASCATSTT